MPLVERALQASRATAPQRVHHDHRPALAGLGLVALLATRALRIAGALVSAPMARGRLCAYALGLALPASLGQLVRRRRGHGLAVDLDHQHLAIIRGRRLQLEEGLRVRAEAQHRLLDDLRRGRVRKLTCSAYASSSTLRTDDKSSCSRHSRSSASLTRVVVTSPFLVRLTGDILAIAGVVGFWLVL